MEDLKLLQLICRFAKKDVIIKVGDKTLTFKAPKKVSISALLFRGGYCQRCGRSCKVGFNLYYTQNEYFELPQDFKKKLKPILIKVNNKEKYLWYFKNPTSFTKNCAFLEYDLNTLAGCKIHEYNPIHCALPLIQVNQVKGKTLLIRRQYGRNYRFGCPVKFTEFDRNKFIEWDLLQLERLYQASKYLEVDTWLYEIIKTLEDILFIKKEIPSKNITIYDKLS